MKQLQDAGVESSVLGALSAETGREEEVFRASDGVIDLMKRAWVEDKGLRKLGRVTIKDSEDKIGLMNLIRRRISKAMGWSS